MGVAHEGSSKDWLCRDGVGASQVMCPNGHWLTVYEFLCSHFQRISPQEWRNRFASHSVLCSGGTALAIDAPFQAKQAVYYFRTVHAEPVLPYFETVIYQDDSLVVADKPHFLPVIPSGQYVQETLLVRLKRALKLPDLVPLHRIDRDTAGLVMFSVQPAQRAAYHALFREGRITKTYHAIAPCVDDWTHSALPLSLRNRLETADNFMQMRVVAGQPNTHTHILSMERLPSTPALALYTLQPHTGKRHQLRVHMHSLGAPIVGDCIYPEFLPERDISVLGHAPLQLLAHSLAFIDPILGEQRRFQSQRKLSLCSGL